MQIKRVLNALDEATVVLPLEGMIDLKAERVRLGKDRDKAANEAKKMQAKLSNADFVARAPEEIVEENRSRLAGPGPSWQAVRKQSIAA